MAHNAREILDTVSLEGLTEVADILNRTGFATDEDGTLLSSTIVEQWTPECTTFLRTAGYAGGSLEKAAKFFEGHGAVYCLYNTSKQQYADAQRHIANVAARNSEI